MFASRVHGQHSIVYQNASNVRTTVYQPVNCLCPVRWYMPIVRNIQRPANAAIWACALITIFRFFRKSNTTVAGGAPDAQSKCLRVQDIVLHERECALCITAPGSKKRQIGSDSTIWFAGVPGHSLDPVQAWKNHVCVNMLSDRRLGPYQTFSFLDGDCRVPLLHRQLVSAAKDMVEILGEARATVSGHSFRRGGASFDFQAGVPDILIQRQGDWVSACYRECITMSRDRSMTTTSVM